MNVLGFDTATPATVVAVLAGDAAPVELRHAPAPGERPGHAAQLLPLAQQALDAAGLAWDAIDRLAVGVGPGTFTGLRIGVATARALAQGTGAQLVGVPTLEALAAGVTEPGPVLAVLDARRGEAFAAGWDAGTRVLAPAALSPEALAEAATAAPGPWLAVGDGAIRFRSVLERAGSTVPPDDDGRHLVSAAVLCRLAREAPGGRRPDTVVPEYLRLPDAEIARQRPSAA